MHAAPRQKNLTRPGLGLHRAGLEIKPVVRREPVSDVALAGPVLNAYPAWIGLGRLPDRQGHAFQITIPAGTHAGSATVAGVHVNERGQRLTGKIPGFGRNGNQCGRQRSAQQQARCALKKTAALKKTIFPHNPSFLMPGGTLDGNLEHKKQFIPERLTASTERSQAQGHSVLRSLFYSALRARLKIPHPYDKPMEQLPLKGNTL